MHLRAAILPLVLGTLLGFAHIQAHADKLFAQAGASASSLDDLEAIRHSIDAGQLNDAETSLREFITHHSDSADGHYLLGLVLFREIQISASREGSTQGAPYNDLSPALAEFAKGHAEASLAEYTAGARTHKPTAADLKIVAFDYVILGDFASADKWLTRALEWNPQDADSWYNLGRAKYNLNRFDEGIRAFEQALKLDPGNVKAEDNLGLCYEGLGNLDEAIAAYRKALDWQQANSAQSFVGPNLDLGSLLLDQNKPEEAIPYLVRAAEIAPREAHVHEKLGRAYSELNNLPLAQQELEKAVQLSPENPRLHFMLGQIYRKEGFVDKAKAEMDRSAALHGTQSIK
jgi:tetratricopeptide (TPR) repeat protein